MFRYNTFIKTEFGELKTVRGKTGLDFIITVNEHNIFLAPYYSINPNTGTFSMDGSIAITELILHCSGEEFEQFKAVFKETDALIRTYYNIVVDDERHLPYKKRDIETLLTLDLLPDERQKLQLILNEFTFIYLIRDGDTGYTKIGRSNSPKKRLEQLIKQDTLQATPNNYFLIAYWLDRSFVETNLHEAYKAKRVRGEWFDLSDEDMEDIRRIYIQHSELTETLIIEA
jgi:hypothetical protein